MENVNTGSMAFATSGGVSGGSTMVMRPLQSYVQHACLFDTVATDIHPQTWYMSVLMAMAPGQQAGLGLPSASADASAGTHALLWTGTAASFADLNPGNAAESKINACAGSQQAGYIIPISGGFQHAALWSGAAASTVGLHPVTGFNSSAAFGSSATQQVGYAVTTPEFGGAGHAGLWSGTPGSFVGLHPAGYTFSIAFATNGVQQAGYTDAQAMAIDAAGNIVGYANGHAFLWRPVQ